MSPKRVSDGGGLKKIVKRSKKLEIDLENHPPEGIYRDVPAEVYRRWPYMNASVIKAGAKSMLEAYNARSGFGEENPSMAWGTLLHQFVLEGRGNIVAFPGRVRRGREFEEFKAAHGDNWIVTSRELEGCEEAKDRVDAHKSASELINNSEKEVSIVWRDSITGYMCKARVDGMGQDRWFDYKTTRTIDAGPFYRQAYSLGWHLQMAHYRAGLMHLLGRDLDCYIVAQESKKPFDVRVFRLRNDILTAATLKRDQIFSQIVACIESNKWPGIDDEIAEFELPEWATENKAELEWGDEGDEDVAESGHDAA